MLEKLYNKPLSITEEDVDKETDLIKLKRWEWAIERQIDSMTTKLTKNFVKGLSTLSDEELYAHNGVKRASELQSQLNRLIRIRIEEIELANKTSFESMFILAAKRTLDKEVFEAIKEEANSEFIF